eukprot:9272976-Karenia_brevis.AAC.1
MHQARMISAQKTEDASHARRSKWIVAYVELEELLVVLKCILKQMNSHPLMKNLENIIETA